MHGLQRQRLQPSMHHLTLLSQSQALPPHPQQQQQRLALCSPCRPCPHQELWHSQEAPLHRCLMCRLPLQLWREWKWEDGCGHLSARQLGALSSWNESMQQGMKGGRGNNCQWPAVALLRLCSVVVLVAACIWWLGAKCFVTRGVCGVCARGLLATQGCCPRVGAKQEPEENDGMSGWGYAHVCF